MNNTNVEIERKEIMDKLAKFNENMQNSKRNVNQRLFFVEDARQERTEMMVTEDRLPALFREG